MKVEGLQASQKTCMQQGVTVLLTRATAMADTIEDRYRLHLLPFYKPDKARPQCRHSSQMWQPRREGSGS